MRKTMLTIAALAALGLATAPAMAEDHAAQGSQTEAAAHAKVESGQHKAAEKRHEKKHHKKKHHKKKHHKKEMKEKKQEKKEKQERKEEGKKDSDDSGK